MATSRKYAGLLPDLDEDQDLFETPELTDDTSTRPTESIEDEDEDEDTDEEPQASGISRHRLNADTARSQFTSSKVDARRTDFSDRLDSKRRSYRVTTRRKGGQGDDAGDGAEISDSEDATPKDGLKRKIASLLQEAEELKAEAQRQHDSAQKADEQPDAETLQQLSSAVSILEALGPSAGGIGAEARLAKQLSEATAPISGDANRAASEKDQRAPTYTLSYQPSFDDKHAHSLAASFDTRLKELETALGLTSIPLPTQSDRTPKPLLPTLDSLEAQVAVLSTTTPAQLDTMSKRIRQLTDEADRLDARRKAAKQSYAEMRAAAADAATTAAVTSPSQSGQGAKGDLSATTTTPLMEDAEMETKVAALYQTLPTIESLAPSLPAVLERLKSLRLLHADAADAATRIQRVEEHDKEVTDELAMWRQALQRLEKAVGESETTTKKNMSTVEGWVKELEGRVGALKTAK